MFKRFTNACVALVQKYLPDPFLFAIVLTIVVFILGIVATGQGPMDMITHWGAGFWNLLAFSMQMALVLVKPYHGKCSIIKKGLSGLHPLPRHQDSKYSIITAIACWINWGSDYY